MHCVFVFVHSEPSTTFLVNMPAQIRVSRMWVPVSVISIAVHVLFLQSMTCRVSGISPEQSPKLHKSSTSGSLAESLAEASHSSVSSSSSSSSLPATSGGSGSASIPANRTFTGKGKVTERTILIGRLLNQYDKLVFPGFHTGKLTEVSCGLYINSFDSISVDSMDVTLNIYFRQSWVDSRLRYDHSYPDVPRITLDISFHNKIWIPDTYFPNEKGAKQHSVTVPNRLVRIYPNGTVFHSSRYTIIASCPMDLYKFPLDNQECVLKIESYSYPADELRLNWMSYASIEIAPGLKLAQFQLAGYTYDRINQSYISGEYTSLRAHFYLTRKYGFYLIQTYIPSAQIVILSWVSFWINHDAIPARISLGVLTVLSMTTENIGLWMTLPKVSYVKAIDIWISVCVAFVFLSTVEFAIVNTLTRRDLRMSFRQASFGDSKATRPPKYSSHPVVKDSELPNGNQPYRRSIRRDHFMAKKLDKICRVVFPATFAVFNIFYWSLYVYG